MNYIVACRRILMCWLLIIMTCHAEEFTDLAKNLNAESFSEKTAAAMALYKLDDPRVLPTLKAMQEGNEKQAAEFRQLGKELGKQMEKTFSDVRSQMQPAVSNVIDKVNEEAEELKEALDTLAGTNTYPSSITSGSITSLPKLTVPN